AAETRGFEFIGSLLHELREKPPDITFQLHSGNADDVLEKIEHGLLEFGLVINPVEKLQYDYLPLTIEDTWGNLVNTKHPLAKKTGVTPSDIET
ncbi:LysR family transcriptional regulator substrate-binding protein, partial [Listeria monocytogenes]|nr:LysR family transcriptional regulator substrate-binding protein [Listeria monocytogenes]